MTSKLFPNSGSWRKDLKPFTRKTDKTSGIRYQTALKIIYVHGWSTEEDAAERYNHLITTIDQHFTDGDTLFIFFRFNQVNASTTKYMLNVIRALNRYQDSGKTIKLYWCCNDSAFEMIETGKDLREFSEFDFHINCN